MRIKKIKAFSLAEMMVVMLIITIVMAAVAPVATHKSHKYAKTVKSGPFPVGTVLPYTKAEVPQGWLICNGQAVSKLTYSSLYDAMKSASSPYTSPFGEDSTKFNLPDLRGRTIVGQGGGIRRVDSRVISDNSVSGQITNLSQGGLGNTGGSSIITLTLEQMPRHTHTLASGKKCSKNLSDAECYMQESGSHNHGGVSGVNGQHHHLTTSSPFAFATDKDGSHGHDALYFWASEADNGDIGNYIITSHDEMITTRKLLSLSGIVSSTGSAHSHSYSITGVSHAHNLSTIDLSGLGGYISKQGEGSGGAEGMTHYHAFTTSSTGSGTPMNNMPPYMVLNYIIKY